MPLSCQILDTQADELEMLLRKVKQAEKEAKELRAREEMGY